MNLKGTEMPQAEYLKIKVSLLEKQISEQEIFCRRYAMQRNIAVILCAILFASTLFFAFHPAHSSVPTQQEATAASNTQAPKSQSEIFVASVSSDKYHRLTCNYADLILKENCVYYITKQEAEADGKSPCSVCRP